MIPTKRGLAKVAFAVIAALAISVATMLPVVPAPEAHAQVQWVMKCFQNRIGAVVCTWVAEKALDYAARTTYNQYQNTRNYYRTQCWQELVHQPYQRYGNANQYYYVTRCR